MMLRDYLHIIDNSALTLKLLSNTLSNSEQKPKSQAHETAVNERVASKK